MTEPKTQRNMSKIEYNSDSFTGLNAGQNAGLYCPGK